MTSEIVMTMVVTDVVLALPKRERLFADWAVQTSPGDPVPPFSAPDHPFFRTGGWRRFFAAGVLEGLPSQLVRLTSIATASGEAVVVAWCDYLDAVTVRGLVRWRTCQGGSMRPWRSRVWRTH